MDWHLLCAWSPFLQLSGYEAGVSNDMRRSSYDWELGTTPDPTNGLFLPFTLQCHLKTLYQLRRVSSWPCPWIIYPEFKNIYFPHLFSAVTGIFTSLSFNDLNSNLSNQPTNVIYLIIFRKNIIFRNYTKLTYVQTGSFQSLFITEISHYWQTQITCNLQV
jgi:hypothetical protein